MTIRVQLQARQFAWVQRILRWSQYGLLSLAIAALGGSGWTIAQASLYQHSQNRSLERLRTAAPLSLTGFSVIDAGRPALAGREGAAVGRIEIPRIGLSAMVLEGAESRTLRLGVGHIPGTALPGDPGNIALAGHRDTFFRGLQNIRNGDRIILTTLRGSRQYLVKSVEVVRPADTHVLDRAKKDALTLITCYPFSFLGAAPERFVVHAEKS
jgi:sortase A